MEPIRSGTTTERIVRTSILTVLLVGYSALSFKDGYYSYPRKNAESLKSNLDPAPQTVPEINPRVTRAAFEPIQIGNSASDVEARLGQPTIRQGDHGYYFGPGGLAKITIRNDKVVKDGRSPMWFEGQKTELDLLFQKVIGVVTGVLGLLMVLQLIRVLRTRVELTEEGLKVTSQGGLRFGGSPLVPFEAMTGLNTDQYRKKGWVQVEYSLADGRQGAVSLNDYVHKGFPRIVTEICTRCGFDNPIKRPEQAEEVEAAGQAEPSDQSEQQGGQAPAPESAGGAQDEE